jgi:hypothetical protein
VALPFVFPKAATVTCTLQPMRPEQMTALAGGDAVLVYERNGGTSCIDELFAVYPDGRIDADYGVNDTKSAQVDPQQVQTLLETIDDLGWFTDNFYDTHHTPCGACFRYSLTVKYKDQVKTVNAVDGGVDAPAAYWLITGHIAATVPLELER